MKKLFLGLTPFLLVGCSFLGGDKEIPQIPTIDSFTIESGDTGLTLHSSIDKNFENVLSTHPILESKIKNGILTFTENIDSVPMTRSINLKAFVDFLNK